MRKHYIDNLRNFAILLLFPVHTFMIWNDFGNRFYIWEEGNRLISTLIVLINPWFMPLLFVIAGISARYALEKRSLKQFMGERVNKLLIPFLCGMVLLVPFQTLYNRKFFEGYQGGILENIRYFFTHYTDLSGYDGGFTPGHLWFILFLFLISLVTLPLFRKVPCERLRDKVSRANIWVLAALFLPVWLMYYLGNFGGFSLGKCLCLYVLGYYVLSDEGVMETLERHMTALGIVFVTAVAALGAAYYRCAYYGDPAVHFVCWMGILFFLPFGRRFLNRETGFTRYFNRASFPIYILHQSILVVWAYYVFAFCGTIWLRILLICFGSFALTVLAYQIIKYIPYLRRAVGIK